MVFLHKLVPPGFLFISDDNIYGYVSFNADPLLSISPPPLYTYILLTVIFLLLLTSWYLTEPGLNLSPVRWSQGTFFTRLTLGVLLYEMRTWKPQMCCEDQVSLCLPNAWHILAEFYLLTQLDAPMLSDVTQPFPVPTSISSPFFFTLPGLSSPSFPFLPIKIRRILHGQPFKCDLPLASRSDAYFLWTVNDPCTLFPQLVRHLTLVLCPLLLYMSSLLMNFPVSLPDTYNLLNRIVSA